MHLKAILDFQFIKNLLCECTAFLLILLLQKTNKVRNVYYLFLPYNINFRTITILKN